MSTRIHPKMSTKIHPKRGLLVDKRVHEMSPLLSMRSHLSCPRGVCHPVIHISSKTLNNIAFQILIRNLKSNLEYIFTKTVKEITHNLTFYCSQNPLRCQKIRSMFKILGIYNFESNGKNVFHSFILVASKLHKTFSLY